MAQGYSPLGIAFDTAFFNRNEARARLKRNIELNTHALIT